VRLAGGRAAPAPYDVGRAADPDAAAEATP